MAQRAEAVKGLEAVSRILKKISPYLLLLPIGILLFFFIFGLINGILQSFGYAPFMGMTELTLDYYAKAMQDERILASVGYSLYLASLCTITSTVGAILLSAALTKLEAGNRLKLFAINMPLSVAHIVVVVLVIVMCGSSGMIPRVLFALGLIDSAQSIPTVIGAQSGWGIVLVLMFKETSAS